MPALLGSLADESAPAKQAFHALCACLTLHGADSEADVQEFTRRFKEGKGAAITLRAMERHINEPTADVVGRGLRVISRFGSDDLPPSETEKVVELLLRVIAAHPTNGPLLAACFDVLNNLCREGVEEHFWAHRGADITMGVLDSQMINNVKVMDSLFAALRTVVRNDTMEAELVKRGFMARAVEALRLHPQDPDAARSIIASLFSNRRKRILRVSSSIWVWALRWWLR